MTGIKEIFFNSVVKTFDMLAEGIVREKQECFTEVRVRNMRQPTGWTVPNPDLGDGHFRDKGPTLHVLKWTDFPRFTAWKSK
jgi:hypothetical protein